MTAEQLWEQYCAASGTDKNTPYEAWSFGGDPDGLAELVLQGRKTATASGYDLYLLENAPIPKVGDLSILCNANEEALCVIRTTKTTILPFDAVGEEQAWKEGEGDRSLQYWRKVHEDFFTKDYASCGALFTHDSKILCEEFVVLFSVAGDLPEA